MENKEKENEQAPEVEETQPQGKSLQDASMEELKIFAFDTDQNIKALQRQYSAVMQEMQLRVNGGN